MRPRAHMLIHGIRGSVLLGTLIVATLVAILCGSYVYLISTELRASYRTFQYNAATNIAEAGVEEAMWALANSDIKAASGWTLSGADAYRVFNGSTSRLELGGSFTGELRVRVDGYAGSAPVITAEGRIHHPRMSSFAKQVRVKTTVGGSIHKGFMVRDGIVINNKPRIDSYNSALGPYNSTTNRGDKGMLVALNGSINLNDSQIWGKVGVGASSITAVNSPMNGGWLRNSSTIGTPTFDTTAVTTGIQMTWPARPTAPVQSTTGGSTLTVAANATTQLGTTGATTPAYYYYSANGGTLNMSGTTSLHIKGPTVLVIQRGLQMSQNAKITFDADSSASLQIFVSENVNVSGANVLNDQPQASRLTIYGAGSDGQNIALSGTTKFTGVFYGPTWNVNVNSAVEWNGGVLAAYANLSSSLAFHFDEALAAGGSGGVTLTSWQALGGAAGSSASNARDARVPFN